MPHRPLPLSPTPQFWWLFSRRTWVGSFPIGFLPSPAPEENCWLILRFTSAHALFPRYLSRAMFCRRTKSIKTVKAERQTVTTLKKTSINAIHTGDVVDNHSNGRITNVWRNQTAKSLLPSRVPQLQANLKKKNYTHNHVHLCVCECLYNK